MEDLFAGEAERFDGLARFELEGEDFHGDELGGVKLRFLGRILAASRCGNFAVNPQAAYLIIASFVG